MATTRQVIAAKKLAEIVRKSKGQKHITIGKILKEAGYSTTVSESPTKVTESKGFKLLMDEYLPEDLVFKTHRDLLEQATLSHYKMDAKLKDEEIESIVHSVRGCKVIKIVRYKNDPIVTVYYWIPDGNTRKAAADMAYKIRGTYAPEKQEHKITGIKVINYGDKKV